MIQNLKNKKILLFCPRFFNYETEIKKELENQGAIVDYFDERFGNTFLIKSIIRLRIKILVNYLSNKYYLKILKSIKNKNYDRVFFISPETITNFAMEQLKKNLKNSKFILYMWDSFKNKKESKRLVKYFDKVYSFDKEDCKKYKINFLPLFYIDKYDNKSFQEIEFKYDISFVGTGHEDRFLIINKIQNNLKRFNTNNYFYLFLQSKKIYFFRKIFDKRLKNAKIEDFHFKSLAHEEIINISEKSKAILDIQRDIQSGLTMRTIEIALGMRKKLITTNLDIKEYDFYDKNNILIIDRKNPIINKEFLETNYHELNEKIYQEYSIKNWIKNLFI